MRTYLKLLSCVVALMLCLLVACAQSGGDFDLSWWTIDGGGATPASNGVFSVSFTIGQPDASNLLSAAGSPFELTSGFWFYYTTCIFSTGDVNLDGCTDDADLLAVLYNFGATGPNPADLNCDLVVDDADLLIVLYLFGNGC